MFRSQDHLQGATLYLAKVTFVTEDDLRIETCWSDFKCFNPSNAKLNPICHLLALLGSRRILHVSRIRVNINNFMYVH
jgi:hypothetical protein